MMKQCLDTSVTVEEQPPFDRIVLTGFRATGKSLVGRILAERLGLHFCDTDTLLCAESGFSVREFVDRFGWPDFRRREEQVLRSLQSRTSVVIATGGGSILHEQAWRSLRKKSIIFWLRADFTTIKQRLTADGKSVHQRPSLTGGDFLEEIREQLALRSPLYRRGADVVIDTDGRSPSELVRDIIAQVLSPAESREK